MRAVQFTWPGEAVIVERPQPHVIEPDDAVVLVTTAALAPWDIARCQGTAARLSIEPTGAPPGNRPAPKAGQGVSSPDVVPGGEFAGNIVEIGPAITRLKLNDLVFALSGWTEPDGRARVFGTGGLDGGHADYVRVPRAEAVLIRTTAASEERSLLAGGTLALGAGAAEIAMRCGPSGHVIVVGCDPLGIAAVIALRGKSTAHKVIALDHRPARLALARRYGAITVDVRQPDAVAAVTPSAVVVVGALAERPGTAWVAGAVCAGGTVIFAEPDGVGCWLTLDVPMREGVQLLSAAWPSHAQASGLAQSVHLGKLDLKPFVSHVVPLDDAAEAYKRVVAGGPAVQKVLLKP